MERPDHLNNRLLVVSVILSAGIFASDFFTPLGIADGISYIAVVLLSLWMKNKKQTIVIGVMVSVLTIAGIAFSKPGESAGIYLTNRFLSLLGIWSAAFLIIKFRKSEEAAARDRNQLQALFNHAREGIILTNADGKIRLVNPWITSHFNYEVQELKDHALNWLFGENILNTSSNELDMELESRARKKNGDFFPAEIKLSSFELDGELNHIVFVNDITDRKRHQEQILQNNEELMEYANTLKETNAELENFAYISSHDLQEPLRKIQSFGDRLRMREKDRLGEDSLNYIERMLNASSRMQQLIDDLLTFSRLTSRARTFEPVNLNQIVEDVLCDLEVSIEKSGAFISVISALPVIEADPTQMRQLFQNLISNAIKFRKKDEQPRITIHCNSEIREQRPFINIIVEDNGIGFNEKYSEKIFGIFQRLDTKNYPGSGIGLAICKKIVQRHGGEISAKSQPGEGTYFIISLPIHAGEYHLKNKKQLQTAHEKESIR